MLQRSFAAEATVSVLGFGCSRIGSFNNPASPRESQRLLGHALDIGITLFDTADIYGQGDSERALGQMLQGRRDAAFVVSKVGQRFSTAMRIMRPLKPLLKPLLARSAQARAGVSARRTDNMDTDFSPGAVTRALERSLARLRFETLDALLLHSPTAADLADPDLGEALAAARRSGKIRHFGVACDDVASLEAALTIPDLSVVEIPPPVLDAGQHLLSSRHGRIAVLVREVIRYRGALSPTAALADMIQRPGVTCVVAGTGSPAHLDELARAADTSPMLAHQADRRAVNA